MTKLCFFSLASLATRPFAPASDAAPRGKPLYRNAVLLYGKWVRTRRNGAPLDTLEMLPMDLRRYLMRFMNNRFDMEPHLAWFAFRYLHRVDRGAARVAIEYCFRCGSRRGTCGPPYDMCYDCFD